MTTDSTAAFPEGTSEAQIAYATSGATDRAGRKPRVDSDPLLTWPLHSWDDPDGDGHNCHGCPVGSTWRCDELAHPEHDPDCQGDPCDCQVWHLIRAMQAGNVEVGRP